jgi:hypothetical protein
MQYQDPFLLLINKSSTEGAIFARNQSDRMSSYLEANGPDVLYTGRGALAGQRDVGWALSDQVQAISQWPRHGTRGTAITICPTCENGFLLLNEAAIVCTDPLGTRDAARTTSRSTGTRATSGA